MGWKCREEWRRRERKEKEKEGRTVVRYDVGHSHEILLLPTSFGLCYEISIHFLYLEWPADKRCFMSHEAKRRQSYVFTKEAAFLVVHLCVHCTRARVAAFLHIVPKATQIVSHSLGENLVLPACVATTIRCEGVRV